MVMILKETRSYTMKNHRQWKLLCWYEELVWLARQIKQWSLLGWINREHPLRILREDPKEEVTGRSSR